jgi:hypothetical protein
MDTLFPITNISLGQIPPRKTITIIFPYNSVQKISKMVSPCDCSQPEDNREKSRIIVRYTPKEMSEHIKASGAEHQVVKKTITVFYFTQDESSKEKQIELSFTAAILR